MTRTYTPFPTTWRLPKGVIAKYYAVIPPISIKTVPTTHPRIFGRFDFLALSRHTPAATTKSASLKERLEAARMLTIGRVNIPSNTILSDALIRESLSRVVCTGPRYRPWLGAPGRLSHKVSTAGRSSVHGIAPAMNEGKCGAPGAILFPGVASICRSHRYGQMRRFPGQLASWSEI
jgi:hypothetical protein